MENNADQLPDMQLANCQNVFHDKQTEMDLFSGVILGDGGNISFLNCYL